MPVANFFPSPSSRSARACPLARPPARSSSSLSVLLWFALFAPVLVQNETSQVSLPFSLFLAFLFPVSVFLAACFFVFLRRRRIRAAGELLRFLFPFGFVRADSTTSAHCTPLMVSFYPAL